MPPSPGPDPTVSIGLLGDLVVTLDGEPLTGLRGETRETLTLIALSDAAGIDTRSLITLLPAAQQLSPTTIHQRVKALRNRGVPIATSASGTYCLSNAHVTVDADTFVRGVAGISDATDPGRLDDLMRLWRGDPWAGSTIAGVDSWKQVRRARTELIGRLAQLDDDDRAALVELERFVGLFPDDRALDGLRRVCRRKPRILVIEDQIMEELWSILDSHFTVQPVNGIEEWNGVRDSLDVEAALIDRHLTVNLRDDRGTTVIADFLRRNTEIPAALMTVAPPTTIRAGDQLQAKYRLLEVVHKVDVNGDLNGKELLDVARALVDRSDQARTDRLRLWVKSDLFHVEQEQLFNRRSSAATTGLTACRRAAETALAALAEGRLEKAERLVRDFHRVWGPGRSEARS